MQHNVLLQCIGIGRGQGGSLNFNPTPCATMYMYYYMYMCILIFILDAGQTWMELAYGTQGGGVRVIVRHPENIGHTPQLFQSYNVHTNPVSKVVLGEKHLVSGRWNHFNVYVVEYTFR